MCAGLEEPQESLTEEALSWPWSESDMTEEGSERCSISFLLFFFKFKKVYYLFWPCCEACGVLLPLPENKPVLPAVEAQSPNHCTAREVPRGSISDS